MSDVLKRYDIYLDTVRFPQQKVAECVLKETSGALVEVGFRYIESFLNHKQAFPLNPVSLPLGAGSTTLKCNQGLPGFLDDYLPDEWGARVLARIAFYRDKRKLNQKSPIDMLSLMGGSRIGALAIVPYGESCEFAWGNSREMLYRAEDVAHRINEDQLENITPAEFEMIYLAHSGSGVGGARPKSLVYDDNGKYLAKYNQSQAKDAYNNARVELACMLMANSAGINISAGTIIDNVNGRDVLLIDRFDIDGDMDDGDMDGHHRHHLVTFNALLKDNRTQADHGGVFTYDGMYKLLAKYSSGISNDGDQLLRRMFFNACIHNLDDHERNFSLIHDGQGYRLSPAYDMVPSVVHGAYPIAGYQFSPFPPRASEYESVVREFGLSKIQIRQCAEEVITAIEKWESFAEQAGVSDVDMARLKPFIRV